jgi:hypothetical protein
MEDILNTKLRVKIGTVEVDYEGSDEMVRTDLPQFLRLVVGLSASVDENGAIPEKPSAAATRPLESRPLSASTMAARLQAKSGAELAFAAAAALVIGEAKDSFSRAELLQAMKSAKSYYKSTHGKNLTNYLNRLVRSQKLLDQGSDRFGIHHSERDELVKALP